MQTCCKVFSYNCTPVITHIGTPFMNARSHASMTNSIAKLRHVDEIQAPQHLTIHYLKVLKCLKI